jgi:hypothetical protein
MTYMMNARDWSLVAKKVGVGAVITLVPLLILVAALWIGENSLSRF